MSIPVASLLVFALWTVIVLAFSIGVLRWRLILAGKAELRSFPGDEAHGPPFYRRATRAHANCIENLPIFTAIVFAAHASRVEDMTLDVMSLAVVVARVLQTCAHLVSGSNLAIGFRFFFFMIQLAAFFGMSGIILHHAA